MRSLAVALLLVTSLLLSGCSGGGGGADGTEVVIQSTLPTEEVRSDPEGKKPVEDRPTSDSGHLAGIVVDEAIRPIEGAVVSIPGLDLSDVSDRDGRFGFVDLRVGPYFVTVNHTAYYAAETVMDVVSGELARAKFVLTARPPPEPYHITQAYQGFAQLTANEPYLITFGCTCFWTIGVDQVPAPTGIVIEARMPEPGVGTLANGFSYELNEPGECCGELGYGSAPNPMRYEVNDKNVTKADFDLSIVPTTVGAPELNKAFDVYVTTFYNGPPPAAWSFVNGDV